MICNNNISVRYNEAGRLSRIPKSFEKDRIETKFALGRDQRETSIIFERWSARRAGVVCARHAGIAMRSNSVYSVRKPYVHGLYTARPRRLAALAKVKNIPSGTAARASHVRSPCTCTDTLLDLARLPVSRGIGEYSCPIWSLTPPRGSFLDRSHVYVFPDLSYQSYPFSARLRLQQQVDSSCLRIRWISMRFHLCIFFCTYKSV